LLGEHSVEILKSLDYSSDKIVAAMREHAI
jgi:hypothetical protein